MPPAVISERARRILMLLRLISHALLNGSCICFCTWAGAVCTRGIGLTLMRLWSPYFFYPASTPVADYYGGERGGAYFATFFASDCLSSDFDAFLYNPIKLRSWSI